MTVVKSTCIHQTRYVLKENLFLLIINGVPTQPGKPGKMRALLENLEKSWNFEKFNKYHGKMIGNLQKLGGY